MSGRRAPHLQRRNGIYHLRVRVPDIVRPVIDRSEVRRSFGTSSYTEARLLAARYAAKVMEAFDVIVSSQLAATQAQAIVQECFADLQTETTQHGGFVPSTDRPALEKQEQLGLSRERISALEDQIAIYSFDHSVTICAADAAGVHGIALDKLSSAVRLDILSGVARALIEQQRLFQLRVEDRLACFVPKDTLFVGPTMPKSATAAAPAKGLLIGDAIDRYLKFGRQRWVLKTHLARVWQLRFFAEHVGSDMLLEGVTSDHIRTFRDAVLTLHKAHGRMRSCSFAERQTGNAAHRVSHKTASIIFEPIKAFMRWAKSTEGLISVDPAIDIRMVTAPKAKGDKARRPFAADELRTLFNAPIFCGCRSVHRRYEPGSQIIKDAKYWVPILAFYSGARLGELIQLDVCDVHVDEPIPYLSINEDNIAGGATSDRKHVKSHAGVRMIPLHPELVKLGFVQFAKDRARQRRRGRTRLFSEFSYGSDGQASTVFSKFFARFMNSVSLTDPKLVFHSLRHNAEDAFRDAMIPQYVIDRVIGHSDQTTSASYGNGVSLDVMFEAVKAMRLKIRLTEILQI